MSTMFMSLCELALIDSVFCFKRKTLEDLLAVFRKADFDKSGTLGKADFAEYAHTASKS
jgi:hypothetical protein